MDRYKKYDVLVVIQEDEDSGSSTEWVKYSDVKALEAERDESKELINKLADNECAALKRCNEKTAHIERLRALINEALLEQQHPFSASILQTALEIKPKDCISYIQADAIKNRAQFAKEIMMEKVPLSSDIGLIVDAFIVILNECGEQLRKDSKS